VNTTPRIVEVAKVRKLERQLYEAKKKLSSYPMPGLG
jgi:hypothetical protein